MDLELEWTQALCVWQQWPVPATTDIQALREQIVKKGHWRESEEREITVLTPVGQNLLGSLIYVKLNFYKYLICSII